MSPGLALRSAEDINFEKRDEDDVQGGKDEKRDRPNLPFKKTCNQRLQIILFCRLVTRILFGGPNLTEFWPLVPLINATTSFNTASCIS